MAAAELRDAFTAHGIVAVKNLLTPGQIELLRAECFKLRAETTSEELVANDCMLEIPMAPLEDDHAGRTDATKYFESSQGRLPLREIILASIPAAAAAVLDSPLYLFNEHYVLKPGGGTGAAFCWHTDAAHQLEALLALAPPSSEDDDDDKAAGLLEDYVSTWVALDDITEENGALVLLPRDANLAAPSATGSAAHLVPQPRWFEPASAVVEAWLNTHGRQVSLSAAGMCAGDAIVFSSRLWHCSEPNGSTSDRRVYYAQYSRRPILSAGARSATLQAAVLSLAIPTAPCVQATAKLQRRPLVAAAAHAPHLAAGQERGKKKRLRDSAGCDHLHPEHEQAQKGMER
jgi:hypothetical protein